MGLNPGCFPIKKLVLCSVIAALYFTLTVTAFGISFGGAQFRVSEALCVLPFLFPETALGVFAGCLLANIMSPFGPIDIVFGSLATLIAAIVTSKLKNKWLTPLPMILSNALIVGAVISYAEAGSNLFTGKFWSAFAFNAGSVGIGEAGVGFLLGVPLIIALQKTGIVSRLGGRLLGVVQ